MEKVKLGKTGLEVTRMGFGGIPLQRLDEKTAIELVHRAQDKGYNFIDTARGYTVSENYIGAALKGRRQHWTIATKSMARTGEAMAQDIHISLENLQTDVIDLYQCHNIKTLEQYEGIVGPGGAMEALLAAKREGKIRHIGFSAHSVEVAMEIIQRDEVFETLQFPFNFIEDQGVELFLTAKEKGLGTLCMKPVAGGAITEPSLGLRYILSKTFIDVLIPGMDAPEQIDENMAALQKPRLTSFELESLERMKQRLGATFCRRCGYCLPCSVGIDIPTQFIFEGYHERYDLAKWSSERYHAQTVNASACIKCGVCEPRCPYNLPIMDMMEKVSKTFGIK